MATYVTLRNSALKCLDFFKNPPVFGEPLRVLHEQVLDVQVLALLIVVFLQLLEGWLLVQWRKCAGHLTLVFPMVGTKMKEQEVDAE